MAQEVSTNGTPYLNDHSNPMRHEDAERAIYRGLEEKTVNVLDDPNIVMSNIIHAEKEKGAKQYQEDSTCTYYSPDLTLIMASVFDGHGGLNGQVASSRCAKLTEQYFQENWRQCKKWTHEVWQEKMRTFFEDLHNQVRQSFIDVERQRRKHTRQSDKNITDEKKVVRKTSGFPVHGGTTASIIVVIRTPRNKWRIVCANVGDSDVLLLARKPPTLGSNQKCCHLSIDHSPDNPDEFLRIQKLDARQYPTKLMFVYDQANVCRKFECPVVFLQDGTKDPKFVKNPWGNNLRPTNVRYDPAVYAVSPSGVSHDITCIAMTRSLGDFYAHQFGLSHQPSVTIEERDFDKEFLITVGSDGIWDCWKWDDFSDYVNGVMTKQDHRLNLVVRTVLRHTVARAKACFGESSFDDASLVIVALRPSLFPPYERIYPNHNTSVDELKSDIDILQSSSKESNTSYTVGSSGSMSNAYENDFHDRDSQGDVVMNNPNSTNKQ